MKARTKMAGKAKALITFIVILLLIIDFALIILETVVHNLTIAKATAAAHGFILLLIFAGIWFLVFFSSQFCTTVTNIFTAVLRLKVFWIDWSLYMGVHIAIIVLLANAGIPVLTTEGDRRSLYGEYGTALRVLFAVRATLAPLFYYATKRTLVWCELNAKNKKKKNKAEDDEEDAAQNVMQTTSGGGSAVARQRRQEVVTVDA